MEIQLQILTLTLDEGEWLASRSGRFVSGEEAPVLFFRLGEPP
jgi:hypothetical protein